MKKSVKALLLVMCAIVLVVATVFTTLAYISRTTQTISNTFSVGDLSITLHETVVNQYGVAEDPAATTSEGNEYKLVPGATYMKDPTITVKEDSETCYVFAKIDNNLTEEHIEDIVLNDGWAWLDDEETIAYYTSTVNTVGKTDQPLVAVFSEFKTQQGADFTSNDFVAANYKIDVTGYAVQAEGFEVADGEFLDFAKLAWNSAFSSVKVVA